MAPFEARLASARKMARRAPIRVSDLEKHAGTRYSIDTVEALLGRYPGDRFIWLMGADALAEFHLWKDWRKLAESLPIAVVPRPGYDDEAHAARAMGWLRRFVQPSEQAREWTQWSAPAIILLRLPPDPSSATAIRALDPDWHSRTRASRPDESGTPTSSRRALARPSH